MPVSVLRLRYKCTYGGYMVTRRKIAMLMAEFLGTALLTLAVLAVSKSTIGIPYFVAIAAGLVVATVTLTLGAVSGAHLNPLVTIGLWSVRRVKTLDRKSTRLNSSHGYISYAVFCLKK